jgi:hypothetical protein
MQNSKNSVSKQKRQSETAKKSVSKQKSHSEVANKVF